MKGRDKEFKCIFCGKYISHVEIGTAKIEVEYIPDTEYTKETTKFWHVKCDKKNKS